MSTARSRCPRRRASNDTLDCRGLRAVCMNASEHKQQLKSRPRSARVSARVAASRSRLKHTLDSVKRCAAVSEAAVTACCAVGMCVALTARVCVRAHMAQRARRDLMSTSRARPEATTTPHITLASARYCDGRGMSLCLRKCAQCQSYTKRALIADVFCVSVRFYCAEPCLSLCRCPRRSTQQSDIDSICDTCQPWW